MTLLAAIISDEIAQKGPMSVARYMDICLSHPTHGYYTSRTAIGASGDFVTAPEISQMFGEILGLWLVNLWQNQGQPERYCLVELGPGRGTLMSDILRVVQSFPDFCKAAQIWLVETSPKMRAAQSKALAGHQIAFANHISEVPEVPIYLVANEFFDALPIRQFVKSDIGWQERLVDTGSGKFRFVWSKPTINQTLEARYPQLATGIIVETSGYSTEYAKEIGARISKFGGGGLIIDYGDFDGVGDTFQAVKDHSKTDSLTQQGKCDLTAHVNFGQLAVAAGQCDHKFSTQGKFLERMGISERARQLAQGEHAKAIAQAHRRLVDPEAMGKLFKVLALFPKDTALRAGFTL